MEAPAPHTVDDGPKRPTIAKSATMPVDKRIKHGVLENGLHYFIMHNEKPENRAELRLALRAGSLMEDEDQLGVAHFVEHMCFNGSENFEKNELVDYLESVGTRFGPDLNAYTSFDETVYMLQVRTDDTDLLSKGLLILEDWAGGVHFENEEIDKERGVVVSEWRSRLSPDQRMQKKYFPVMYQNSRYAERMPIGKPEIIETASYETIKRFYTDWYRPDLMAVIVVGDVDIESMESEIKTRFSGLQNPDSPRPRNSYDVPDHPETLVSICSDKEAPFTQVRLMYKHDHVVANSMTSWRKTLVHSLYNRMLNARLSELSKSPEPPFIFAYTGFGKDVGTLATYESFAMVPEGKSVHALKSILTENERVKRHGFVQSELERQKIEMIKSDERRVKELDKTESNRHASRMVYHFLNENPIPGPEQRLKLTKNLLPTIQRSEINALAQKWITDENRVIVITSPEKEGLVLPEQKEVLALFDAIKNEDIAPYEDVVSDAPLLTAKLIPGQIISEVSDDNIHTKEWVLNNGVKVVLKKTDFKNDEVLMKASSIGGHSMYNIEDYKHARFAARIIDESGVGDFTNTQLGKKLAGKNVSVYPFITEMYEGLNGNASPEDIETLFKLIYMYFTMPRKDPDAVKSFISKQKGIYANLMSNPQYWFSNESIKIKFDNHPRRGWPNVEDIEKVNVDQVFRIYKERFGDADDFTFYFVGAIDEAELRTLCTTYLANLPTSERTDSWKDVNADYVDGKIEKVLIKGKAPKSEIDITYHGDFDWNGENRFKLKALVDILRIKMRESMREDKGGVYGVRVSGFANQFPEPSYTFNISFNSDPEKVDELIETAMKDIETVQTVGAEEKDLKKIKETNKQSRIKSLKRNRYWLSQLEYCKNNNLDAGKIQLEYLEEQLESLTSDDIKGAANQFLNGENMIKLIMMPDSKKEEN